MNQLIRGYKTLEAELFKRYTTFANHYIHFLIQIWRPGKSRYDPFINSLCENKQIHVTGEQAG